MSIYIRNYLNKLEGDIGNKILKGNDILVLSSSKQLNLFILKNVYDNWTSNFEKNKSRYFDYKNDKILEKINSLQNILSNHINIKFEDLRDLVKVSIIDLIEYIYEPKAFLKNDLNKEKILNNQNLERRSKFFVENKRVFTSLIKKSQKVNLTSSEIALVVETFSYERNQKLIDELRSMLDCEEKDLKKFYKKPLKYDELFDVSEREAQEIINIANSKESFIIAAEFILDKIEKKGIDINNNNKMKELLREIKENFI